MKIARLFPTRIRDAVSGRLNDSLFAPGDALPRTLKLWERVLLALGF